jgi:exosome complex RNA-binding protein Rrp42 (RNase PH superfamily)
VCQRAESNSYLLLLDASLEEEACSYCQVHVAVDPPGDSNSEPTICALRKTGVGSLPWALLPDITALAFQGVPKAMESYRMAKSLLSEQHNLLQEQIAIQ